MSKKIFIRDKEAIETALYKSYAEFSIKYEEYDTTHDLRMIYDNIRKDAVAKDKTLHGKLYKDTKETVEQAKKTDTRSKDTIVDKPVDIGLNGNVNDGQIFDDIFEFFKYDKKLSPKKSHQLIEEKYNKKFDFEHVKKIHYKVYNKHYKESKK
jgi:hypothetical protein